VNIAELSSLETALELSRFKEIIGHQIYTAVQFLRLNWFPSLEAIFNQASRIRNRSTEAITKGILYFAGSAKENNSSSVC